MKKNNLPSLLLRIGLAFAYLYAAVAAFITPNNWIGFFPSFLTSLVPVNLLLTSFSIFEIVLALWLLSGKKVVWSALISAFMQASIVLVTLSGLDIVFRDVGLLFASLALFSLGKDS